VVRESASSFGQFAEVSDRCNPIEIGYVKHIFAYLFRLVRMGQTCSIEVASKYVKISPYKLSNRIAEDLQSLILAFLQN
jgi:hypothetical protein